MKNTSKNVHLMTGLVNITYDGEPYLKRKRDNNQRTHFKSANVWDSKHDHVKEKSEKRFQLTVSGSYEAISLVPCDSQAVISCAKLWGSVMQCK